MTKFSCLGLTAVLVFAGCIAVACGGSETTESSPAVGPDGTSPAAATVRVSDDKFSPQSLTISTGTRVTWNWSGHNAHSVVGTFDGQDVQSPTRTGSGTFSFTFNTPGTYNYYCSVHGKLMSGTVTVQ